MMKKINIISITLLLLCVGLKHPVSADSATATPTVDSYMEFKGPCHSDPRVVGKCFSFRGRARFGANLTSMKIWMIGTQRVLGVRGEAPTPENLDAIFRDDLGAEVYGIFTVCPCTPYQKGVMQFVCIDSVKITKVVKSGQ